VKVSGLTGGNDESNGQAHLVRRSRRDPGIARDCVCCWLVWWHTDTSAAAVRAFVIFALTPFEAYHARSPGYGLADFVMIQEQTGNLEEARKTAAQLIAARSSFTIASFLRTQFRSDVEQLEADVASLRAAVIPENE
jgi:hypothetical protein